MTTADKTMLAELYAEVKRQGALLDRLMEERGLTVEPAEVTLAREALTSPGHSKRRRNAVNALSRLKQAGNRPA